MNTDDLKQARPIPVHMPLQTAVNSRWSQWTVREYLPEPNKFRVDVVNGTANWLCAVQMNGELMPAQQKRIVDLMAMAPELRAALQDAHNRLAVILGAGYPKVRELRLLLDRTPEVAP